MGLDAAFGCGMVLACAFFCCSFVGQRMRLRWGLRRWRLRFGFYPSGASLGNALQNLQVFTQQSIQHVIEEKQNEKADDDDLGEEELMQREFEKQLRRIRRGEHVKRLRVPFRRM